MRAELLPDAYSPFRLETEVVLIPALLAWRKRLMTARAIHGVLEAQAEVLVGSHKLESARLRLQVQILRTLLSLLKSGLSPEEATGAVRQLNKSQPPEHEPDEGTATDAASLPFQASDAKRAFRRIVAATHPDHAAIALFALAARGVDADEFLAEAIAAQQAGDVDGLVALSLILAHLAPDAAPGADRDGPGLPRHEERNYLLRAIRALQAEQVTLWDSALTAARIPDSHPPRLGAAYIERLIAQHRTAIVLLETQLRPLEQELAQRDPAEVAAAQALLQEYHL